MSEAKNRPETQKIHHGVLIPCNIHEVQRETEEGTSETVYRYEEIQLSQSNLPNNKRLRRAIANRLNQHLREYLYSRYDQGTQSTIQGFALKADRLGRSDIVDECEKILDWIAGVLDYYDTAKQSILSGSGDPQAVQWDFEADVPPQNLRGWREIRAMFDS